MNSYGPTVSMIFPTSHRALTNHFPRARGMWIGLHDIRQEGVVYWVDGVLSNSRNTKWKSGEPNNAGNREDCGELNHPGESIYPAHPVYTINNSKCFLSKPGLCEAIID